MAHDHTYSDFDEMAAGARHWDIHCEQVGRGAFKGRIAQVILTSMHLGRVQWDPGILERGSAPAKYWTFGVPIACGGTLHARARPIAPGQLAIVPANEDIAFTANGQTDLMVVSVSTAEIERWMRARRGVNGIDRRYLSRPWAISSSEMKQRAMQLRDTLNILLEQPKTDAAPDVLAQAQAAVLETVLVIAPSIEIVEPLHRRAKIAVAMRAILEDNVESPLTITDICERVGARERTLFLASFEAFGRSPRKLLHELRLNAARRELLHPSSTTSITAVALRYGFFHLGRFAREYRRQFGESPSTTLIRARA